MEVIGKRKLSVISSPKTTGKYLFFQSNQKYLNLFAFFSVFPLFKIGGISITFFIFLFIAFKFLTRGMKIFHITEAIDKLLLLFLLFVLIATVVSEVGYRDRSLFSILKLTSQYVYWVVLALFIKTWIYDFSFYKLSRVIFVAISIAVIYYVTINPYYQVFRQNALAYTVITAMPLAFYYVMKRFSVPVIVMIAFGFFMVVLFSGSRTGTALVMFELLLILSLANRKVKKISILTTIVSAPIVLLLMFSLGSSDIKYMKYGVADVIEDYSPHIASTLRMKDNIFERDKSWLIRELMLQKGKKIFIQHPFFGVGPGNFTNYYVALDRGAVSRWLLYAGDDRFNKVSSQNSYLLILTEMGIFAFISIVLVFFAILRKGFYYVKIFKNNAEIYIYIPFISLLIYSVMLVATTGALFWLILGLAMTLTQRKRHLS